MSAPRLANCLLRASRSSVSIPTRQIRTFPAFSPRNAPAKAHQSKIYAYTELKSIVESPSAKAILVDTREPLELRSTGTIPGSLNIPVTSAPDAFYIEPEEFEDRFGFQRPKLDQEIIFYCKAGVRSRAAAELARQAGYENVSEYPGSWLDWEKNGGAKESVK